jgi:hypothetical protein
MPSQAYSQPLFDLFSFARRGPGRRDHLSPVEIQQVARTVRRTPEVMVKVLPKSANTLAAVRKHLGYIGRRGELDLETDDGERLRGTRIGKDLVEDWDLDLDEYRRKSDLTGTRAKEPARLVHKVIFSMPAGTPPENVLTAVKNFAREEFALKHRYVMALHTDTPRPHVHVVIKALSEQGERLNIRKATLRAWRREFARHLRDLGVAANATERAVRGENRSSKPDGIYRAALRGDSTHVRARVEAIGALLLDGRLKIDPGKRTLVETRRTVEDGWRSITDILSSGGHADLADEVRSFVKRMPDVETERDIVARRLREGLREPRTKERPLHR